MIMSKFSIGSYQLLDLQSQTHMRPEKAGSCHLLLEFLYNILAKSYSKF